MFHARAVSSEPSGSRTRRSRALLARRRVLRLLGQALAAAALGTFGAGAAAQGGNARAVVRFGILPLGGALESRNDWEPLLGDLGRAIERAVAVLSATSYEALEQAIQRGEVDMAFLSGRMALDAVTRHGMTVLAQVTRHDGLPGYRAVLLTRKEGPLRSLDQLLADPDRWRLARGESRSVSGYLVPQLQLFLPHRIAMETRFKEELVGTHQFTALAVANGQADVATNNTADLERFRQQFPVEFERLQVIWQSELIPHAQIVARRDWPPELLERIRGFLAGYGRGTGATSDAQRSVLKALHDLAGFVAADNRSLLPAATLAYQLERQNALEGQWVSEAARQARLQRLARTYDEQTTILRAP